jgi:hypothetical protein
MIQQHFLVHTPVHTRAKKGMHFAPFSCVFSIGKIRKNLVNSTICGVLRKREMRL